MGTLIHLELNHCQRCGSLVLRRAGSTAPHCNPCDRAPNHLPPLAAPARTTAAAKTGVLLRFRPAAERTALRASRIVPEIQACCADLPEGGLA